EKKILPSAIVCASDETALGVISAAFNHGIKVPEDLSVIGYDNTSIAWMATPALTTIKQPFYEMGAEGCLAVIESLVKEKKIESKILPFELIERQTVKSKF